MSIDYSALPLSRATRQPATRKTVKTVRQQAVDRAESCCQRCQRYTGDWGHAHHIVKRSQGGKWELPNIEYLCADCHQKEHS